MPSVVSPVLKRSFPYFLFAAFCLSFTLGLLLFHHIPARLFSQAMDLTIYGPFHLVENYDSPWFINDANHPIELLEPNNYLQTRPGLVFLVAGLQKLLSPVRDGLMPFFLALNGTEHKDDFFPYALFVLVNYLLLLLSFSIYLCFFQRDIGFNVLGVTFLGGLLVFNDVIKVFLLTPHTQLFNLLVPLLCLYALQQVRDHALIDRGRLFVLAFLVGLGVTAYGTFVLFLPSVVIGLIWAMVRDKARINLRVVGRLALVVALTVLPYLAWVFYVRTVTGSFYSVEIAAQSQFVWILPLLRSNPLAAIWQLVVKFLVLFGYAASQAIALPLALVGVILLTLDREHALVDRLKRLQRFPLEALVISGLFLLFFAIDGEVARRTAFPAVPALVAGTAVVANDILRDAAPLRRRLGNGLIVLLVLLQGLITVFKFGPFN
jgi:hypothetical protein